MLLLLKKGPPVSSSYRMGRGLVEMPVMTSGGTSHVAKLGEGHSVLDDANLLVRSTRILPQRVKK
jgi:hypothetical protein